MADNCLPFMLITANVGSIFEDPEASMKIWLNELLKMIKKLQPYFVAIHCQEVGGKQFEQSMKHVEEFVRILMSSVELMPFDRIRIFLDEDFTSDRFTALGSFYFIHENVRAVHIWDFKATTFLPVLGKEIHSGNIDNVTTKEKSKFPCELFPECKRSRKGFLRTRWHFDGSVFDLVNIHLFHDASNFVAMENFPSIYSEHRKHALSYMLDRFQTDAYEKVPVFVFGDFNFRLNAQGVITRLTHKTLAQHVKNSKNGDVNKIVYREANDKKIVLTLGKKEFEHCDHNEIFTLDAGQWLREYDQELQSFIDRLFEYEITFPPSYPFAENINYGRSYMKTRCPAWCDRVLLGKSALSLVYNNPDDLKNSQVLYHTIGPDVCMGDHKPVYLMFRLVCNSGMPTHHFLHDCNGQLSNEDDLDLRPLLCKASAFDNVTNGQMSSSRHCQLSDLSGSENYMTQDSSQSDEWATPPELSPSRSQCAVTRTSTTQHDEHEQQQPEANPACSNGCECGRCTIL